MELAPVADRSPIPNGYFSSFLSKICEGSRLRRLFSYMDYKFKRPFMTCSPTRLEDTWHSHMNMMLPLTLMGNDTLGNCMQDPDVHLIMVMSLLTKRVKNNEQHKLFNINFAQIIVMYFNLTWSYTILRLFLYTLDHAQIYTGNFLWDSLTIVRGERNQY